jgi:hypothetical protein
MPRVEDGDFSIATVAGDRRYSRPFSDQGDNTSALFEQDFMVNTADFTPTALGSTPDDLPDYYLVAEGALQPMGGGVSKFTRTYAQVPASRTTGESYAMTFPGMTSAELRQQYAVSASVISGASTTLTVTPSISDITAGDMVIIRYRFTDLGGIQYFRTAFRVATSASGTTLVIPSLSEPSTTGTITFLTLIRRSESRAVLTQTVASYVQFDYFMPGLTSEIETIVDVPILTPLEIIDADGMTTDTVSSDTSPSLAEYIAQVNGQNLIVAEASSVTVWKGQILQRSTRFVIAR